MQDKIVVTVEDGTDMRTYKGDFIHVNAFNKTTDGMEMNGESSGSHFIPRAVVIGTMESLLKMISKISETPKMEEKLLTVVAEKLLERAEKLDSRPEKKPKPNIPGTIINREEARQVLKGLLAAIGEGKDNANHEDQ